MPFTSVLPPQISVVVPSRATSVRPSNARSTAIVPKAVDFGIVSRSPSRKARTSSPTLAGTTLFVIRPIRTIG